LFCHWNNSLQWEFVFTRSLSACLSWSGDTFGWSVINWGLALSFEGLAVQ